MSKQHARKKEVRRRMKETGKNYQAALNASRPAGRAEAGEVLPMPNANAREDFINGVWDAEIPQMVKVLLYELASRMDLKLSDWSENSHHVQYEEHELARSVGFDVEAANLCRDLAIEANWLVELGDGVVQLRQPHEDWDLYLCALNDRKQQITDRAVYRSRLAAFEAETRRLRTERIMTVRRIYQGMMSVIGHTYLPRCIGGEFAQFTHGLGSGETIREP
nr:hypothetical protein OH820_15350 [Streptomyces sp. NBC_00857]